MGDTINLQIKQGATWRHEFIWLDDATGLPVDLTGWTARMQIRRTAAAPDPPAVSLTSSPAAGLTITTAEGKVLAEISATVTTGLAAGAYVYDLELEETATGYVEPLAGGRIPVAAQVTR